jgi:hypothetical protein
VAQGEALRYRGVMLRIVACPVNHAFYPIRNSASN